ncbi:Glycogen synthase [Rubripirellula lacrimiformis]|uniref:Glycogen synthase n=1 Tax=Rubripirellula lacrimiformis TaxID=1930273 RepID=A0A517N5I4_9BACT|nr:glycogen synthase GlgA [Rubripirellula lacrimiformis]QDT02288.1 Glycogen synthase [Rubripirellula lacrimiformis]
MNIVYLTTEAVPFAKTGGLADVCGTLPSRVAAAGNRAAVIMPAFRSIRRSGIPIESTDISFAVPMSREKLVGCRLLKSTLPDGDTPVWFIDQPQYFDRDALYGTSHGDYADNDERFSFFCRAAIMAMARIGWSVDIVHCNDWQTGLIPSILKSDPNLPESLRKAATVLTIHNLAYQGSFPRESFHWTGLNWSHFNANECEFYNQLNFLKTGIASSDVITTVSPRYAEEIRTQEHGCGLEGVLESVSDRLVGITNGIDMDIWDPATDPNLPVNYDVTNWQSGKTQNKRVLQKSFGLDASDEVPMIGLVGRLASQKGWDSIVPLIRTHLSEQRPTQWIVLGSGDARYESELRELAKAHPNQFALHIGFSDKLAHQIEASSDLFLMPSHYEPCGLNQLYSLRYGSVPVVTPTGGLANTVVDCNETTIADGTATGFYLSSNDPAGLDEAVGRALRMRYHDPQRWARLVATGMQQDWSWTKSANEYIELYGRTLALKVTPKRTPPG